MDRKACVRALVGFKLTSHRTQKRLCRGRFLQGTEPNKQCQSTDWTKSYQPTYSSTTLPLPAYHYHILDIAMAARGREAGSLV